MRQLSGRQVCVTKECWRGSGIPSERRHSHQPATQAQHGEKVCRFHKLLRTIATFQRIHGENLNRPFFLSLDFTRWLLILFHLWIIMWSGAGRLSAANTKPAVARIRRVMTADHAEPLPRVRQVLDTWRRDRWPGTRYVSWDPAWVSGVMRGWVLLSSTWSSFREMWGSGFRTKRDTLLYAPLLLHDPPSRFSRRFNKNVSVCHQ